MKPPQPYFNNGTRNSNFKKQTAAYNRWARKDRERQARAMASSLGRVIVECEMLLRPFTPRARLSALAYLREQLK